MGGCLKDLLELMVNIFFLATPYVIIYNVRTENGTDAQGCSSFKKVSWLTPNQLTKENSWLTPNQLIFFLI